MNIFDFITSEELDDALTEEPPLAFSRITQLALKRLEEKTAGMKDEEREEREALEDARYGFMVSVLGIAKKLNIEPFSEMEMPTLGYFNNTAHRQFKAQLNYHITQLIVDSRSKAHNNSIRISASAKEKIIDYLNSIRDAIARENISQSKKDDLLKRIDDFEAELAKGKISILSYSLVALTLLSSPGGLVSTYDAVSKLTTNIVQIIAHEKNKEDEMKKISPPRAVHALAPPTATKVTSNSPLTSNLDDEIPF